MLSSTSKKARLFRTWTAGHPLWCGWQVTYRCNFRCKFCGYWHDPMGEEPEPTVRDYADGAAKLASFGSMFVSLAGGETLLREDLPEVARAIGRFHLPFVTTNGWLATPELAEDLMRAGLWGVSISIDYADPAKHDTARGMRGAWKQAWRAVEMFLNARKFDYQRVNVIAVLMRDNLSELEELMVMAAARKAYFMVQPYGYLKTGSHAHVHNNGPVGQRLLNMWRRNRNFLSNPRYLSKFDQFLAGGVPGCRAGRAFFNIDSTGDIAICVERRGRPIANLLRDSQHTIRDRLRAAAEDNPCTRCWYNCRGEVESLYKPGGLLMSLPTFLFNHGSADGKMMGRWSPVGNGKSPGKGSGADVRSDSC
jgi:MoaA/NifB/PqqE/SkfB family radical SAM enzyme